MLAGFHRLVSHTQNAIFTCAILICSKSNEATWAQCHVPFFIFLKHRLYFHSEGVTFEKQ